MEDKKLNLMRIVITGTDGFIGKNLINELTDKNDILEINQNIFDSQDWVEELYNKLNSFGPDVIFHVGACSDTLETDVNYMMLLNYLFTQKLSDWCSVYSCKMIYSSSAANYGINGEYPSNLYGWSKFVAEQYILKNNGVALRYFNVYGSDESHKGRMASVAFQMMEKHKKDIEVKLFPLNPTRDFVYIKDVIFANIYALEHYEELKSNWYDVGFGESRNFEDVMNILNIPFSYHKQDLIPSGYQFYTCSNKEKWMEGWKPKYNLEEGLNEYKNYILGK